MEKMKNILFRKALLDRDIHLYEFADMLHISNNTLRDYLRFDWPEELTMEMLDFVDGKGKKDAHDMRKELGLYINKHKIGMAATCNAGGYAARVMRAVDELELKLEKEREGWF